MQLRPLRVWTVTCPQTLTWSQKLVLGTFKEMWFGDTSDGASAVGGERRRRQLDQIVAAIGPTGATDWFASMLQEVCHSTRDRSLDAHGRSAAAARQ
jgi:hypothetical protein